MCVLQVLVTDPKELEKIREREFDITSERIKMILAAGANVILTTKVRRRRGCSWSPRRSEKCNRPCRFELSPLPRCILFCTHVNIIPPPAL